MVLPASGQLSFSQIRVELQGTGSATSTTGIRNAELGDYGAINSCSLFRPNGPTPSSVSEWYGYDHAASASIYLFSAEGPYASSALACSEPATGGTDIYIANSVYYASSICTSLVTNGFYSNSSRTNWYQFTDGALVSNGACTTTTTTTTTATCQCPLKTSTCSAVCPYQCACDPEDPIDPTAPCYSPCV